MNTKLTKLGISLTLSAMAVTGVGVTTAGASTSAPVKAHTVSASLTSPEAVCTLSPEAHQAIVDQIVVLRRQLHPVKATKAEKVAVRSAIRDLQKSLRPKVRIARALLA